MDENLITRLLQQGLQLKTEGKLSDAKGALQTLSALTQSNDIRVELELIKIEFELGDAVEEKLKFLIKRYRNNPHPYRILSEVYVRTGFYKGAVDILASVPNDLPERRYVPNSYFAGYKIRIAQAALDSVPLYFRPEENLKDPYDKAAIVMMVKDEEDIIGQMLDHHYNLGFRKYCILDNNSSDMTRYIIESFKRKNKDVIVIVLDDPIPGYFQARKTQSAVEYASSYFGGCNIGVDWIFVLDADEFIMGPPGKGLVDLLEDVKEKKLIVFHLCNAVNSHFRDFNQSNRVYDHFDRISRLEDRVVTKNVFLASIKPNISTGNHFLDYTNFQYQDADIAMERGWYFVHVPWRSSVQLKRKITNGARALFSASAPVNEGTHWKKMYDDYVKEGEEYLERQFHGFVKRIVKADRRTMPVEFF